MGDRFDRTSLRTFPNQALARWCGSEWITSALRSFGKLGSPSGIEMPQVPAAAPSPSCEFVLQRDEHRSFGDVVHAVLRRHVEEETEAVRRRLRGHRGE
jgi:hypothetical protein